MKVQTRNSKNQLIDGELITKLCGLSVFVPNVEPWGENRINILNSRIAISGEADDDGILIGGFVKLADGNYKDSVINFWPVKK